MQLTVLIKRFYIRSCFSVHAPDLWMGSILIRLRIRIAAFLRSLLLLDKKPVWATISARYLQAFLDTSS
jgi:hypothetical protein